MAKGKYAARAANRLAHTDNDLLKQKAAEVESLTAELGRVNSELTQLRVDARSEARAIASRMAADDVRNLTDQLAASTAEFEEYRASAAFQCWRLYSEYSASLGEGSDYDEYLRRYAEVFRLNPRQQAELRIIADPGWGANRSKRRLASNISKLKSQRDQVRHNPEFVINQIPKDGDW